MDERLRAQFLALKQQRWSAETPQQRRQAHTATVDLLNDALNGKTASTFEDVGFCYWNISDNHALNRCGDLLAANHRRFETHVKQSAPHYRFWTVNDATQRFTLEKDGFADLWWRLYREAVESNADCTLRFLQFGAHRAALSLSPVRPHSPEQLAFVRSNFENLLGNSASDQELPFYETVYLCLVARFSSVDVFTLRNAGERLLGGLSAPAEEELLTGEWQSFVTPFGKAKQASVALNSVINALLYGGHNAVAAELYRAACAGGMKPNAYIEKRLTI